MFYIDGNETGLTIEFSSDINDFQKACIKEQKTIDFITLVPKAPLIYKQKSSFSSKFLTLIGFKGFDVESSRPHDIINDVAVLFSKIDFYNDNQKINENCRNLTDLKLQIQLIKYGSIRFLTGNIYNKRYCIELFKYSTLYIIEFEQLSETFLRNNHFKFISDNLTNQSNFHADITKLLIEVYYLDIDKDIFNNLLYKRVQYIVLKGYLKYIEPLFGNLSWLTYFF